MTRFLGVLTILTVLAGSVFGQDIVLHHHTNPEPPPREVLERLNLQLGWRVYLPVEGKRDGIFTVQIEGKEIFVQTRSGLIVSLDALTGRESWRTGVGLTRRPTHHLGFNKSTVFVVNGAWIFALDRSTGRQMWSFNLPSAPSAAPAADDYQVYLSLGASHIYTYQITRALPGTDKGLPAGAPPGPRKERADVPAPVPFNRDPNPLSGVGPPYSPRTGFEPPVFDEPPLLPLADKVSTHFLEETPLQIADTLMFACADGGALGIAKLQPVDLYFYPTSGPVTAAPGQYEETAYLASQDHTLAALSIVTGKALWRFTGPTPIFRKPEVTDDDIYISPSRSGLYRLDRATGEVRWINPTAERFLSANPKFVYATDRSGRLLVLDKKRGTTLSGFDTKDFVFPIANEASDRFYLAAHNGLLICLHDKEYRTPLVTKTPPKPPKLTDVP